MLQAQAKIKENLHYVCLVLGILYGFYMFGAAVAAVEHDGDALLVGLLAYLFIFLPAFFGGLFSGTKRADNSDILGDVNIAVESMFDVDLPNHILARVITAFYFAFWTILGVVGADFPVMSLFIWVIPAFAFGFFANKDMCLSVGLLMDKALTWLMTNKEDVK